MENILLELLMRTQNIQAKYCERIKSLDHEIGMLLIELHKITQMQSKKKKPSKEDDLQSKKEIEELKQTLLNIEKRCEESTSISSIASSSSSSSSISSSSSSSSDSSRSDSSSSDDDSNTCSYDSSSSKVNRSTSSGSRLSSIDDNLVQKCKSSRNHHRKSVSISEESNEQDNDEKDESNSLKSEKSESISSKNEKKSFKKKKASNSKKKEKRSSSSSIVSKPLPQLSPEAGGVFEYLINKYHQNPVDAKLIEISANSFDEYEEKLLPNIVDSRWEQNHWLSRNIANSTITIKFNHFSVKINKYRIRVGCSNGLGRFSSWEIEGITKGKQKVTLDKVLNSTELTENHPEATIPIQNEDFISTIIIMMRGKNTDNNYKMRFRNIEIFGETQFDK